MDWLDFFLGVGVGGGFGMFVMAMMVAASRGCKSDRDFWP